MHPEEHELLLFLENNLSSESRGRVEAHLAECGSCAHKLAALFRLPRALDQTAPPELKEDVLMEAVKLAGQTRSSRPPHFSPFFAPVRIAFAGAAVAAIALATYLLIPHGEAVPFRSDKEEIRRIELTPEDGASVAERTPQFRWKSIPTADVYRFSLMDQTGALLWVSDPRGTSLSLPASVVLQPGKTYLWRVETFFTDKTVVRSAVHAFTYEPD